MIRLARAFQFSRKSFSVCAVSNSEPDLMCLLGDIFLLIMVRASVEGKRCGEETWTGWTRGAVGSNVKDVMEEEV